MPANHSDEAPAEEQRRDSRSATVVAVAILLSKLVGLLRQRVVAHYFGTGMLADVVAAAFRIGNVTQNLLGEGTLSATFIPVYAKLRAEGKHDEAVRFAQASLGLLTVIVIVVSALGVAAAPWLSLAVAAGFEPEKLAMTSRIVRIVFPMTGVLVLCAWALGVLNAHRKFFMPYAAPIIWSATQMGALLVAGSWLLQSGETLARALAVGALGGALLELSALLAKARPLIGRLRPRLEPHLASVREAARRLPGVLLGRGVIQISGLVDTLLVSFLGTGANATFAYAQMLYLLPMSLLGTGEAAVSLPEMARDSAIEDSEQRHARMRARLATALSRIAALAIPAMVVLMLFGRELCSVLLKTGKFDDSSTARVAQLLAIYGVALGANASVRLFATTFFALGNTKLPAQLAVVRVVFSTAVALLLMWRLGVAGVVIGAVSAGWLEAILLGWRLSQQLGGLGLAKIKWLRLLLLAIITAAVPLAVRAILPLAPTSFFGSLAILTVAGLSFGGAAAGLGLFDLRSLLRRR